jgi:cell division protein FtsB
VPTIWSRLTRLVALLLLAAALMLVALWYLPLIRQNQAMREELLRLDAELRLEEERAHRKKAAIDALRNDPKAVERLAREKLGLARPGETVVHFEPALGTNAIPSASP